MTAINVENQLEQLVKAQHELLQATSERREAELLSIRKSKEAIDKHNEAIEAAVSAQESGQKVLATLNDVMKAIDKLVDKSESYDIIVQRIDIVIVVLQTLTQVVVSVVDVNKDQVEKLQNHILRLTEISSTRGSTRISGRQVNVGDNVNSEQN